MMLGNNIEESDLPHRVFEILEKFNGVIFGEVEIRDGILNGLEQIKFEIGDGNHRTYAIHKIDELFGEDNQGFYISVDFYVEPDEEKVKDIFIDLNNQTPIDRSIYTLIRNKDSLFRTARELCGIKRKTYLVPSYTTKFRIHRIFAYR